MVSNDKPIKLDIGSGRAHFEDYITIDNDPAVGADLCLDIEDYGIDSFREFPMIISENKDGAEKIGEMLKCVDRIRAHHILEHFRPENKVKVMALFWALLKPGGLLDIEIPLFPHPASVQDPTHLSFWVVESFKYFIKEDPFGEAFSKRYSQYPSPLFEKIDEWYRGKEKPFWGYGIKLKKVI